MENAELIEEVFELANEAKKFPGSINNITIQLILSRRDVFILEDNLCFVRDKRNFNYNTVSEMLNLWIEHKGDIERISKDESKRNYPFSYWYGDGGISQMVLEVLINSLVLCMRHYGVANLNLPVELVDGLKIYTIKEDKYEIKGNCNCLIKVEILDKSKDYYASIKWLTDSINSYKKTYDGIDQILKNVPVRVADYAYVLDFDYANAIINYINAIKKG